MCQSRQELEWVLDMMKRQEMLKCNTGKYIEREDTNRWWQLPMKWEWEVGVTNSSPCGQKEKIIEQLPPKCKETMPYMHNLVLFLVHLII